MGEPMALSISSSGRMRLDMIIIFVYILYGETDSWNKRTGDDLSIANSKDASVDKAIA